MDYLSLEHHYEEIPAKQQHRRCTDIVCTILSIVFVLGLFTYALIAFIINMKNPSAYLNIDENLVVPAGDANITLSDFTGFGWTLIWTGVLCVSIGLLWLTMTHNFPQYAPTAACILSIISLLVVTFFSIFDLNSLFQNYQWLRWTVAGLAIFVAALIIIYMVGYKKELLFQGLMLKLSARFSNQRYLNFLDILIWLVFTLGFVILILFQQLSFSYYNRKNNDLYNLGNPGFWGVINIIEYIWGIKFLKDTFIFVISGNAIDWYWKEGTNQPTENALGWTNLLCHNWGSVALGSFLNAFLKVPCLLLEILICHPKGFCGAIGRCCENNFIYFLLYLIRTDTYAFINLFGGGYCDSSFECVKLYDHISYVRGKQSPQRNYRIISTIFLVTLSLTLSYIVLMKNVSAINFWFILILFFHVYALTEYFSSFHASAAEGIQTSVIVEMIKEGGYTFMQRCHATVRRELQNLQEQTVKS